MGSTLHLSGFTPSGAPVDEEVWSEDYGQIRRVLGARPQLLSGSSIQPRRVIREIKSCLKTIDMYGGLIRFCTSHTGLGLKENDSFFAFAYDWRKSCQVNARKLSSFIQENEEDKDRRIVLVGHSMGGLVCRLALAQDKDLLSRVDSLIQVGSPVGGSAQSYYSLKNKPQMHRLFDFLWIKNHMRDPSIRAQLLRVVATFDSLYELLPPKDAHVLMHHQGSMYSATHRDAWDSSIHSKLDQAESIHETLRDSADTLSAIIEIVYSDSFPTTNGYLVDDYFDVIRTLRERPSGDQTVSTASALASSGACRRHKATKDHVGLVSCPELKEILKEALGR
jgi:pimeloyl-ACP methyl ester carboxylesterase